MSLAINMLNEYILLAYKIANISSQESHYAIPFTIFNVTYYPELRGAIYFFG